jgi:hypothetical protein
VTLEDGADCLLDFDDAVHLLDQGRGGTVVVSVSIAPAAHEARTLVAEFDGTLEELVDGSFSHDEVNVRVLLDPAHKTPHGHVTLNRATFQRAEAENLDSRPTDLTIWQRGVKLHFTLFGASTSDGADSSEPETDGMHSGDDYIPF